ncbi:MAG: hypothetical protein UR97_C0003G0055, partial [Candidatus Nomurabacteria bacterium GW2011_GWE2_36_115]
CVAQLTTQWTLILSPKRNLTTRERPVGRNKRKSALLKWIIDTPPHLYFY